VNIGSDQLDAVRDRPGGRSARIRESVQDAVRTDLLEHGYPALSHRAVARRAGVDPATVYRRWPTRPRLAVDALLAIAQEAVPLPDSGTLRGDLEHFLGGVAAVLANPRLLRLFHALSIAVIDDDPELEAMVGEFWAVRFDLAAVMVTRAIDRGELPADTAPAEFVEALVAPAYFRALVSGGPLDATFVTSCIDRAVAPPR
jgi:AcrR family transcriptional regulator